MTQLKRLLVSMAWIGIFFSSAVLAYTPMILKVTRDDPHLLVTLPSNPSTGFSWVVVSYDKTKLTLISDEYVAPKTAVIGAEGATVFKFTATKTVSYPNKSVIKFKYARAWEPDSGMIQTVFVNFELH